MKCKVELTIMVYATVEIFNEKDALKSWHEMINRSGTMDDMFVQAAYFGEEKHIEGVGFRGEHFEIHEYDTDLSDEKVEEIKEK